MVRRLEWEIEWKGRIELKHCLVRLELLLESLKQVIGEIEAREPEQWLPRLEQLIKDLERSAEESIEWIPLGLEFESRMLWFTVEELQILLEFFRE